MKYINFSFLTIIVFSIISCEILPRDNPLDIHGKGSDNDTLNQNQKILKFNSHKVACKEEGEPPFYTYTTANTIFVGDHIWLRVNIKNEGDIDINGIKATITSSSNLIQIEPLPSGYYIRFTQGYVTDDYISAGGFGYAQILNDQSVLNAPNNYSYGIEFTISDSANIGDTVKFNLTINDDINDQWLDTFSIIIE